MTATTMFYQTAHGTIMALIKRAPLISPFLFRAYNFALKRVGHQYKAQTYFGAMLNCHLDDMISRTIFYFRVWEPNNSAVISDILRPGDVFIDVGANIGYYTLLASQRVKDSGAVVAIEAAPAIFEQLRENVELNKARNVRLINVAASDKPGELAIYGGTKWNRGATSTLSRGEGKEEARVPAAPLDEILSPQELARITLIKIDIEGAELPVLNRLLETLDRYPSKMQLLVEMAPEISGEELKHVFDRLLAAGFEAFWIENEYDTNWYMRWRRPAALKRLEELPSRQGDILFRPREA